MNLIFTLTLGLIMASIFLFGISLCNIDLSVNMQYSASDMNGFGFTQDKKTMYLNGLNGLRISEIFTILGILLLIKDKSFK